MGGQWMNNSLIVNIKKYITCIIDNETNIQRFQNIKTRKRKL